MTKKSKRSKHRAGGSRTKPIIILVLGISAAVGLAAFLSQGTPDVTPTGPANLVPSDAVSSMRFKGPEDAPVRLVEFADFQCPTCGAFHPVVTALLEQFPTQLKVEFHHYPLISIHGNALAAAIAAETAAEQDAFWEMHDLLFERQSLWANLPDPEQEFIAYAERLGLDPVEFAAAFRSGGPEARVLADMQHAQQLQLPGTPTFFINDRQIPLPRSFGEFVGAIETAINDAE